MPRTPENRGFSPDCDHHPAVLRTIRYNCLCCYRVVEERAETYTLRSCSSCRCIMQISVVEDGKVLDWGRLERRVLARRGINVEVLETPEAPEGDTPKFVGEQLW